MNGVIWQTAPKDCMLTGLSTAFTTISCSTLFHTMRLITEHWNTKNTTNLEIMHPWVASGCAARMSAGSVSCVPEVRKLSSTMTRTKSFRWKNRRRSLFRKPWKKSADGIQPTRTAQIHGIPTPLLWKYQTPLRSMQMQAMRKILSPANSTQSTAMETT